MIKFKIEEKEYVIPSYINLKSYTEIFKIKDLFSDDYFAAKLVSIVTGAKVEDLLESDYQQVSYLATYVLKSIPMDNPPFIDRFEIDGVHYGFFPNWKELTFAEFVDMDTISTKKQEELFGMLHILAAIMFRPITNERSEHDFDIEKYDVKTMQKRAELFKEKMDIKYILGAQFFFINYARKYSSYSQLSLIPKIGKWQTIKLVWKLRKMIWKIAFKRYMGGSLSQTELLETILQNTNISTKKTS